MVHLVPCSFSFVCFLLVISLFKMVLSVVLSGVPKYEKVVMGLVKKKRVLDELRSSRSDSAGGLSSMLMSQ